MKISKLKRYKKESFIDSEKENKPNNIREIKNEVVKPVFNKIIEQKNNMLNLNNNKINSLAKVMDINSTNNLNNIIAKDNNEEIDENKIKIKLDQKFLEQDDKKPNNIKETSDIFKKFKKISNPKITKNNLSISYTFRNKEKICQTSNYKSNDRYKNVLSPITNKKINNSSKPNILFNSLILENKKTNSPFSLEDKKDNYFSPKNNINNNRKKTIFTFNSVFIKKNSMKKLNKNITSKNELEIEKLEPKNINKKREKNVILLKYSKEHKIAGAEGKEVKNIKDIPKKIPKDKDKDLKKEIIDNNNSDNIKEDDEDKFIETGDIKDIEEKNNTNNDNNANNANNDNNDNNAYNKTIFNKIIEEVKGEKNYIQKVVHRQILNQRENSLRNSLSNNNFKKYDTNTYKEITVKRIKNPFNTSLNNDNNNNFSINNSNNKDIQKNPPENSNNDNCSTIKILNYNTDNPDNPDINLNNELVIKKEKNKKSIKIKKIPLNKLRNKMKMQNIDYNIIPKVNNTPRVYPSYCRYSNYSLNKENNTCMERYSHRNFNVNPIPINNNSINNKKNNFIIINSDLLEKNNNEKENKAIYNKVKIKERLSSNGNSNNNNYAIRINKVNSFYKNNNMNNYINNSIQKINNSQKIIRINSGKFYNERNSNQNLLSSKYLSNVNDMNNCTDLNDYQNKIIQEKKIGLFKKKLAGLENSIEYKNLNFSNLYNKKIRNTIFNSYKANQNINLNLNNSNKINSFMKSNNGNNDTISLITYESNTIESINRNSGYQSFRNENDNSTYFIINNLNNKNDNYVNNEIKLEQIITLLSFEDLLIIEDKINIVLNLLKIGKKSSEELFDLWNYFFSSTLKPKFEQIFKYFLKETEAMKIFINYSLILIIICYDFSFNSNKRNININFSLFETLRLVYINLLIAIASIKNKIKSDNKDHYNLRLIEMSNINKIIGQNLINFNNNNSYTEEDFSFNRELLNNNTNLLIKNISLIIKNYRQNNIINLFYSIKTKTLDEINIFFRQNILREDFIGCSVLASTYLKEKQNFTPEKIPYIHAKNRKKYSLIIDLDETLIHFKVNHDRNDEGVLKLRPGVITFLERMREFYEIILFTEASEAYTELLMEAFNKNKYFDYKLYRQHTIIIGQDFVKDLQRIGRPLDKMIIIDNIPQNFRMQKANGINIKPFYGEDQNDQTLFYLTPILINIAKDNIDTRNGLIKYRDEIITKITSNLYRRNNE